MLALHRAAVAVVVALACGCGSSGGGGPSGDGPAGVVVEVDGTVLASRSSDGSERALSAEGIIYADDTVTTGADGFVKIRLDHNGAVLALSNGKKRTLRNSAAWKAKEGSDEIFGDGDDDRTAIAGRQGEKEAGDRVGTVSEVRNGEVDDPDGVTGDDDDDDDDDGTPNTVGGGEGHGDDPKGDGKKDGGDGKDDGEKKDGDRKDDKKDGPSGGLDECDEVTCLLADPPPPCCSRMKKTDTPSPTPNKDAVKKLLDKLEPVIRKCGLDTEAKIRIRIEPDGRVSRVEVRGTTATAVVRCIKRHARKVTFPASEKGASVALSVSP